MPVVNGLTPCRQSPTVAAPSRPNTAPEAPALIADEPNTMTPSEPPRSDAK